MVHFDYNRWNSIIRSTTILFFERHPQEIIPVARRFISPFYYQNRTGAERKSLWDILQHHLKQALRLDDDAVVDGIVDVLAFN